MKMTIISIWLMALLTRVFGGSTIVLINTLSNGNDVLHFIGLMVMVFLLYVVSVYIPNLIDDNITISQLLKHNVYYDKNKELYPYIRIDREFSNRRGYYHKILIDTELVYVEPEWRVKVPLKFKIMIAKKIRFHNKEYAKHYQLRFNNVINKIIKERTNEKN